jgi:MarR-like DNA-binding transcriptional regulator SgrR of sgrS sRNA
MSRQPPKAARGTFYKRQCMVALDCIAAYQHTHKGRSPTVTELARMMGVSAGHAERRLVQAREAGFITWQPYVPRSVRFVKVG